MKKKVIAIDPKGRKIVMAPTKKVDQYAFFTSFVLEALGHPEALVTDMSCVDDFPITMGKIIKLRQMSIYAVVGETPIWVVAQALEKRASNWMKDIPKWMLSKSIKISTKLGKDISISLVVDNNKKQEICAQFNHSCPLDDCDGHDYACKQYAKHVTKVTAKKNPIG